MDNKLKHNPLGSYLQLFGSYLQRKYCKEKLIEPPEVYKQPIITEVKMTFIVSTLILELNRRMIRVILLVRGLYGMT